VIYARFKAWRFSMLELIRRPDAGQSAFGVIPLQAKDLCKYAIVIECTVSMILILVAFVYESNRGVALNDNIRVCLLVSRASGEAGVWLIL
jgi:hypothetical protein